jgi:hypothetical protein
MTGILLVAFLALVIVGAIARLVPGAHRDRAARYCTKHVIVRQGPGGPDVLRWVYGPHRTQGNACDGPEHQRAPGLW